jgi:uncharacterized protein YdhG (YjbR/CyaY superfamily)
MASSKAATVEAYLQELPEDRREVVSTVRDVILRNLPDGYTETMAWGMISYGIPLDRYPTTYNGQPLGYAALAAQKNGYSLYLLGVYADPEQEAALREAFRREGKKLDMGKSCVRFKKAADLPLDAIGQLIAATTPEQYIARYEASRAQ